jgi:hypothetical protein
MRLNFPLQPVPLSSQFSFPASSPFQPVPRHSLRETLLSPNSFLLYCHDQLL